MATETTSATRGNPVLAAGAIMALGAMVAGCQANSQAMMYAQETHRQRVEAWCYWAHVGGTTDSLIEQCVQQAWQNVPLGECDIEPCADTGRFHPPYDARRGHSYK
jgi:hypothetical protein